MTAEEFLAQQRAELGLDRPSVSSPNPTTSKTNQTSKKVSPDEFIKQERLSLGLDKPEPKSSASSVPSVVRKSNTATVPLMGYDKIKANEAAKAKAEELDQVTTAHQAAQVIAKQADPHIARTVDSGTQGVIDTARKNNYEFTGGMTHESIENMGNEKQLSANPLMRNLELLQRGSVKAQKTAFNDLGNIMSAGQQAAGKMVGSMFGITPVKAKELGNQLGYQAPDFVTSSPVFQEPTTKGAKIAGTVAEMYGMLAPGELAERLVAKSLGKAVTNKLANIAIRGAAGGAGSVLPQNIGKTAMGEQTATQGLEDLGINGGIGAAGGPILAGIGKLAKIVGEKAASRIVDNTIKMTGAIDGLADEMKLVQGAKNSISSIDEQISNLNRSNPTYAQELEALQNERKATVSYINGFDPEYTPNAPSSSSAAQAANVQSSTGLGEIGQAGQGIIGNMYDALWKKVMNGDINEGGAPSALLQVAKVARDNGGLRTMEEFKSLAKEVTDVRSKGVGGAEYQNELKRIASKYSNGSKEAETVLTTPNRGQLGNIETQTKASVPTAAKNTVQASGQERGFIQSLERSNQLEVPTAVELSRSKKRNFDSITNEEAVSQANRRIAADFDKAEAFATGSGRPTAEKTATGIRLIQELQKQGQTERAVTVAERLAKQLTEAGQAVQAASILDRLSPEGVIVRANRKIQAINEKLSKNTPDLKLSTADAEKLQDAAKVIVQAVDNKDRAAAVSRLMDRVKDGQPLMPEEKETVKEFLKDLKALSKENKPEKIPKSIERKRDRIVSHLEMEAAKARAIWDAKKNLGFAAKMDAPDIVLLARMAAPTIARGTVKVADFTEKLVSDFGESVRDIAKSVYDKAVEINGKGITRREYSNVERITENFIKGKSIAENDANFIRSIANRASNLSGDAKRQAAQDLQAVLNGYERVGLGRKLSAMQYIAMLLNPLTQVRNIVGNELLYRLERLNRMIATPIDIVSSAISGGPRTVTFKSGPRVWDKYFSTSQDYWGSLGEGLMAGWRGVDPQGVQSKYDIGGLAFRSKYNPITYLEKSLGAVLKGFDYAAYQRAVKQRLSEMAYLDALNSGVKGSDNIRSHMENFMTNLDDATEAIAKEYGEFVTLQNDSVLSKALGGFKRGANKVSTFGRTSDFGAGNLILPFAKTPANLLLRAMDYSPIGIGKALFQMHDVLTARSTDLTRADVIQSVTRALMGTGFGAVSYWLASKGALGGSLDHDTDVRNLQKQSGQNDFQINGSAIVRILKAVVSGGDVDAAAKIQPGDTLWAYAWAQPTSAPMAIGSNIYQSVKSDKSALNVAGDAAWGGLNTLLDSSVLSGIQEAFKSDPGDDNTWKTVITNLVKQVPGMYNPSIVRQINTMMDNKVRETYDPDALTKIFNPTRANIPGQAQQLPQKVSTLGVQQTKNNSILDVFLSPSQRSVYKPTEAAKAVIDLLKETGDKNLAPRTMQKYLSGKDVVTGKDRRVDLTAEQYVRLQTLVGQDLVKRIEKIDQTLPTDKKAAKLLKALNDSGEYGRNIVKKEVGLKTARTKKFRTGF